MTERLLFRAYGVAYGTPVYERADTAHLFQSGCKIDVVGCGDVKSNTMRRAGSRATTSVVGVSRLEVVAP